jgi:hypothetical protein
LGEAGDIQQFAVGAVWFAGIPLDFALEAGELPD